MYWYVNLLLFLKEGIILSKLIIGIAEIDRTPCGAGVSERECDELKCCYDPTSTFKCYKPVSKHNH